MTPPTVAAATSVPRNFQLLKGRMAGTAAERKIRAKTGTVSGICTLAGYAEARSGHTLAFVIFNQGIMTPRLARRWQNKVCELLCR